MSTETTAYPLTWPAQQPRTPASDRKPARFGKRNNQGYGLQKLSLAQARSRLLDEISKFTRAGRTWRINPSTAILSTNIEVRLDGLPYSNRRAPEDPGAAVYFSLDGDDYCLPCDTWDRVEDNIAAIAGHLSSMRAMDRWGVGNVRTHFAGFKALPSPEQIVLSMTWDRILGVNPNEPLATIERAWRKLCSENHPDHGGDARIFDHVQKAWAQAKVAKKADAV